MLLNGQLETSQAKAMLLQAFRPIGARLYEDFHLVSFWSCAVYFWRLANLKVHALSQPHGKLVWDPRPHQALLEQLTRCIMDILS